MDRQDNWLLRELLAAVHDNVAQRHRLTVDALERIRSVSETEILLAGESLSQVYSAAAEHTREIQTLETNEAQAVGSTFGATLSGLLAEIPRFLQQIMAHSEMQAQQANAAAASVANIQKLADDIRQITAESHILAFNARIEAARAGSHGAAFGVVADSLKAHSRRVAQAAQEIDVMGETVASNLAAVTSTARQVADEGNERMRGVGGALDACRQAYQDSIVGALLKLAHHASEIRDRSNQALVHLQFQDRLQQALAQVRNQSSEFSERFALLDAEIARGDVVLDAQGVRALVRRVLGDAVDKSDAVIQPADGAGEILFL